MADRRPRIHIWPDRAAGSTFVHWSLGPNGPRHLVRDPGIGLNQALLDMGGAPEGAIVVIEPGAAPRPIAGPANFTDALTGLAGMMGKRNG